MTVDQSITSSHCTWWSATGKQNLARQLAALVVQMVYINGPKDVCTQDNPALDYECHSDERELVGTSNAHARWYCVSDVVGQGVGVRTNQRANQARRLPRNHC